jgi:hypothetical protein
LIGLCSRACPSPGLTDQGSDTQDSTWILVQHFRSRQARLAKFVSIYFAFLYLISKP